MTGASRLSGGYEISGQVRMANGQYAAAVGRLFGSVV
jgi:hypothetical protein